MAQKANCDSNKDHIYLIHKVYHFKFITHKFNHFGDKGVYIKPSKAD